MTARIELAGTPALVAQAGLGQETAEILRRKTGEPHEGRKGGHILGREITRRQMPGLRRLLPHHGQRRRYDAHLLSAKQAMQIALAIGKQHRGGDGTEDGKRGEIQNTPVAGPALTQQPMRGILCVSCSGLVDPSGCRACHLPSPPPGDVVSDTI